MNTRHIHIVKHEQSQPAKERHTPATSKLWKNKDWHYVRSDETDISRTFARVQREMAAAALQDPFTN